MRRLVPASFVFAAATAAHAQAGPHEARVNASREAVKALGGALQSDLKAAIEAGGPVNAIAVCNARAPAIASDVSRKLELKVGRTSQKLRNPGNAPDAWEKAVLEDFAKGKQAGENPATLERYEVVGKEFRYMKAIAIPADAPCLRCHGENIDAQVQAKLNALYPADRATGYKTGDLRGAFTVRQPM
jgi:hypothetical protein